MNAQQWLKIIAETIVKSKIKSAKPPAYRQAGILPLRRGVTRDFYKIILIEM